MNECGACLVLIYRVAAIANYIAENVYSMPTLQVACAQDCPYLLQALFSTLRAKLCHEAHQKPSCDTILFTAILRAMQDYVGLTGTP